MTDSRLEAGYQGAELAAAHADRVIEGWKALAWGAFEAFLHNRGPGETFVAQEAQSWCSWFGLPKPPDTRAFGSVIRDAARAGRIVDTKLRPRCGSHGREVVMWKVVS